MGRALDWERNRFSASLCHWPATAAPGKSHWAPAGVQGAYSDALEIQRVGADLINQD